MIDRMIDRLTIIWIVLMIIVAFLGIFFDKIYGQDVIDIVVGLISLYFIYAFCEAIKKCIQKKKWLIKRNSRP